jgi:DeoR/GlpR family transcriptional regulator of sugar metabolism
MYNPERQKKILALIQEMSSVSVMDLAKQFAISPITIRRDLLELREKGLLERTFGGAIASQEIFAEGSARYETYDYLERNAQAVSNLKCNTRTSGNLHR